MKKIDDACSRLFQFVPNPLRLSPKGKSNAYIKPPLKMWRIIFLSSFEGLNRNTVDTLAVLMKN
jgi:hypothetical protein